MSKLWKLHKHFLTSLCSVLLLTCLIGYFVPINEVLAQEWRVPYGSEPDFLLSTSAKLKLKKFEEELTSEEAKKELEEMVRKRMEMEEAIVEESEQRSQLSSLEHLRDGWAAEKERRSQLTPEEIREEYREKQRKEREELLERTQVREKRDMVLQLLEMGGGGAGGAGEEVIDYAPDCSFCDLFVVFFNTASSVAKKSINTFSIPMMRVVAMAFAIWVALQIITFVSAPEVRDLKDLISTIMNKSFIIMLVLVFLSTGAINFFNDFLSPIYTTGQRLAQTVISPDSKGLDETPPSCKGVSGIYDHEEGALPKPMGDSILCTMSLIELRAKTVKELGAACIKESWERAFIIIPHWGYLFVGLGLWVGAMVIILGVPFMMIDAVFQLAVAGALLPFGIACFPFKATSGYTKKIWETFLNSMFAFVFVSVISLMLVEGFLLVVGAAGDVTVDNVLTKLSWYGTAFLQICFMCILSWSVLGTAKEFAGEFAGSISSTNIGSQIGTMGASAAKSFAVKAGKETLEAGVETTGKVVKNTFGWAVGGIKGAFRNRKANKIIGDSDTTGGNGRWERNKGRKKSMVTQTSTGSFVVDEKNKNGSRKIQTDDFTIVVDKNGNTSIRYNSQNAKNMLKDNGKLEKGKDKTRFEELQEKYEKEYLIIKEKLEEAENAELKNQEEIDKLKEDKERAELILTATTQAAIEQRMPYASKKQTGGAELERTVVFNNDGKYIGYDQKMEDGSIRKIRIAVSSANANGEKRLYTEVTNIDANGKGETLKSNGMIQAKSTFKTTDGTATGEIKKDSYKTNYGLSAHHEKYRTHSGARYLDREMQNGGTFGFGSDEAKAINKAVTDGGKSFHEFGRYHN
ncbi:MAG: hypothetical protein E7019_04925 [Alphaproteobacteria bacterium]|nr:hypothetical protein [Alphaproteobacteria bacterium]